MALVVKIHGTDPHMPADLTSALAQGMKLSVTTWGSITKLFGDPVLNLSSSCISGLSISCIWRVQGNDPLKPSKYITYSLAQNVLCTYVPFLSLNLAAWGVSLSGMWSPHTYILLNLLIFSCLKRKLSSGRFVNFSVHARPHIENHWGIVRSNRLRLAREKGEKRRFFLIGSASGKHVDVFEDAYGC